MPHINAFKRSQALLESRDTKVRYKKEETENSLFSFEDWFPFFRERLDAFLQVFR